MESDFVNWLRARLPSSPWLRVGPGDDAAVLRLGQASEEVVTCDLLCDGVHFRVGRDSPRRIGRKALAVNLSDLAAMAAQPVAGFFAVALPRDHTSLAVELYEGIVPLAEEFELALAGGDTNTWDGPLVISITLTGHPTAKGPLLRSGARPGDQLLVTGAFGGSLLGRQFDFQPRVAESLLLHERYTLHAGIDCSDGLSLDSARLAAESNCGVQLDLEAVPVATAAKDIAAEPADTRTPLDHALGDGEDFELILAVPPDDAERILADQPLDVPVTRIGHFIDQRGLWQTQGSGRAELSPQGYLHEGSQ